MKKLVIYYSYEGNTQFIAEAIANEIDADILALKPKNEMKTKGFMKFLWGGKQVVFREKPTLIPLDKKPQDYDIIFIGTPIWAGKYAPPFNTFFSSYRLKGKKVAVFCSSAGGSPRAFDDLKEVLKHNEIIGEKGFINPLQHDKDENEHQAREWAKKVLQDNK
ncbi:MAG: NAD(P)H-dependent oxidoreductase [Firmicutes bacterium]|nr:NAD(P)H-dependent oxidoreductase [Bacillota bacterium]